MVLARIVAQAILLVVATLYSAPLQIAQGVQRKRGMEDHGHLLVVSYIRKTKMIHARYV